MWALITCCFVVFEFTTFGGVSNKSWMRFMATFFSAVYSLLVIYLFGNNAIVNLIALTIGIFVYGYIFLDRKDVYISVLGCVTLTLTLINYNHTDAGILRPFNIALGILVSIITFKLFYPSYAKKKLMSVQIDFLDHLCQIIDSFLDINQPIEAIKKDYLFHENRLINDIAAFNRYLEEARMEMKKGTIFIDANSTAFNHSKRIYRLISVLIYHLTTENNRTNTDICRHLQKAILELKKTKQRIQRAIFTEQLGQTDTTEPYHLLSAQEKNLDEPLSEKDIVFTQALFDSIMSQIILYNQELDIILPICSNNYRENAIVSNPV